MKVNPDAIKNEIDRLEKRAKFIKCELMGEIIPIVLVLAVNYFSWHKCFPSGLSAQWGLWVIPLLITYLLLSVLGGIFIWDSSLFFAYSLEILVLKRRQAKRFRNVEREIENDYKKMFK